MLGVWLLMAQSKTLPKNAHHQLHYCLLLSLHYALMSVPFDQGMEEEKCQNAQLSSWIGQLSIVVETVCCLIAPLRSSPKR